ncbi:MAG: chromosomal replication initiator protein DnaA [Anaerolineae bacterium]
MNADQIWRAALGELQLQMTRPTFNTWLKNTRAISYEDGTLIIGVHNAYAKDWLENRLMSIIKCTLVGIVGRAVEAKFVLNAKTPGEEEPLPLLQSSAPQPELTTTKTPSSMMLNSRYTFSTFVVGPNNRLAHAAALAVAENPAQAYNPLFIYGGVGLGKTHLMHALGHFCQDKGHQVLYASSEEFTNELINSILTHKTEGFRSKYRTIDVLLLDDIHFIAGKESTQEEFFHTFNTLHAANKQIVISSDRPPKAILTLEKRICSRFEGGLIADIQPPDLETRIAILRFKRESQPIPVPDQVIEHIAHKFMSNVRELEGALNRVVAEARSKRQSLTVELAIVALQGMLINQKKCTPADVIEVVADFYSMSPKDLKGRSRSQKVVKPRHIAMYLARQETKASLPQIGKALGDRDHTTVLYGVRKIGDQTERDEMLRREVLAIREILYNNGVR